MKILDCASVRITGRLLLSSAVLFVFLFLAMPVAAQEADAAGAKKDEVYLIGPSDILEVLVWREDALTNTDILVRPDGRISLPLLDDVVAAGRTPMQLKKVLTEGFSKYVEAPKVYVSVIKPNSKTFSVLGQVTRPGRYSMLKPTNVLQALSEAQGFTEWAKKDDVVVIRGAGKKQKRFPVDYPEVVSGDKQEQNILLEPGDVVVIP